MVNLRLPAEWEPQQGVWLAWPRDPLTWPKRVEKARAVFVEAIAAIAPQTVHLIVHPDLAGDARTQLADAPNVQFHETPHQDSWVRDYGPLYLQTDDGLIAKKFNFDAWGEKYESLMEDDEVFHNLDALAPQENVHFVLEGGAVETDGTGLFLATKSVAAGRGQSVDEHEQILRDELGAKRVIWLESGIEGDDTDGHIDTIARFTSPGCVVAINPQAGHPDLFTLKKNFLALTKAMDTDGRYLRVIGLPAAPPLQTDKGEPLPTGYANFLIVNNCVLMPAFDDPADDEAATILEREIGRPVVKLDHRDLIWGMGGIHCLSMQIPKPEHEQTGV
jgi:agmatine/peptidylarginine deiminase